VPPERLRVLQLRKSKLSGCTPTIQSPAAIVRSIGILSQNDWIAVISFDSHRLPLVNAVE
jgi:hypothetical protein